MVRSICTGVLAIAAWLAVVHASTGAQRPRVDMDVQGNRVTRCEDARITFDGRPALRAEEHRTLPRASVRTLMVEAPKNGGLYVHGTTGANYEVTLCKAVAGSGVQISDITLSATNGNVSVPVARTGEGWVAFLIVAAPRDAAIDLHATNGPVGLYGVAGTINARTQNGPVSIQSVSGTVDIQADNGPLSMSGGAGSIRIRTENGPLAIDLDGTSWSGAGLEVTGDNGPLSLNVPRGYQSGVDLQYANGPFSCRGDICGDTRGSVGRPRSVHFGGSVTQVRVSTINGPVSVNTK